MKKIIYIIVISICIVPMLFSERAAVLPDVMRPQYIYIEDNRLYISEESSISVFSFENFELVKRIGRKGEGPGEFKSIPVVKVCPDYLFVSDLGRVHYFSREGIFLKEKKVPYLLIFRIFPVGEHFVGYTARFSQDRKTLTRTISLYDNNFTFEKDFLQETEKRSTSGNRVNEVFDRFYRHDVFEDKIFVADSRNGFFIEVFDSKGNKLYEIAKEFEKEKVTDSDKKEFIQQWKHSREVAGQKPDPRIKFNFAEYFPAFTYFTVNSGKIYAVTHKKKDKKNEVVVMDLRGTILKKGFITFEEMSLDTIFNDKYYCLRDNVETEEWELHVEEI